MSKYKKMKQLIADMRLPEYRYKQLLDAVFLQGIMRFEDMKLLPKTLREKLVEQFGETVVEIKAIHHEKSMQTDKVLFELSDGNRVETVGLFYKRQFIKRAGTPFAFHLKAVAASVVSFAQQGLWDYAET